MSEDLITKRRDELSQLVTTNGGSVTPAQVLEFASNPRTALHSVFTWDDTEAAKKYREIEAAQYIRAVVTVIQRGDAEPVRVRAYVALTPDRGTVSYRPVESVLDDDEMRAQLIEDAKAELFAVRKKYGHLTELAELWDTVDQLAPSLAIAA